MVPTEIFTRRQQYRAPTLPVRTIGRFGKTIDTVPRHKLTDRSVRALR